MIFEHVEDLEQVKAAAAADDGIQSTLWENASKHFLRQDYSYFRFKN